MTSLKEILRNEPPPDEARLAGIRRSTIASLLKLRRARALRIRWGTAAAVLLVAALAVFFRPSEPPPPTQLRVVLDARLRAPESAQYIRLLWRLSRAEAVVLGELVANKPKDVALKIEKVYAGALNAAVPMRVAEATCVGLQPGRLLLGKRALFIVELDREDGRPLYTVDDRTGIIPVDSVNARTAGLYDFPYEKPPLDPLPEFQFLKIVERHLETLRNELKLEEELKREIGYSARRVGFSNESEAFHALGRRATRESVGILRGYLDTHESAAQALATSGRREALDLLLPYCLKHKRVYAVAPYGRLTFDYAAARGFLNKLQQSIGDDRKKAEILENLKYLDLCEAEDRALERNVRPR
jgi:hypothetical protein